jgi:hypothetical protein
VVIVTNRAVMFIVEGMVIINETVCVQFISLNIV